MLAINIEFGYSVSFRAGDSAVRNLKLASLLKTHRKIYVETFKENR